MCLGVPQMGMERTEKLSTSVTPDEKQDFKRIMVEEGYETQADLLRNLVYDKLEEEGYATSEGADEGNLKSKTAMAD
jgi:hypothetical protein